ncbi:MAG: hypothetical protein HYZ14_07700 [Bacteroidetes bacterium]|nr:hypothetical protein [Bacteroidota bacterium]
MRQFILILAFAFLGGVSFAQTKTEMQMQIDRQTKSIDSLKAIVDNQANIIENRDRSIMILKEDIAKGVTEVETLNGKIRQKNSELVMLRNYNKSGTAKKITMNNTRASWTIPAGKHWVINQFIGDYMVDLAKDSLGNMVGKEIHVFLKSINNVTLTDISKNQYGPQVYSSIASNHTMQFPLVMTENTTFSIVVYKGRLGSLELCDAGIVCTYFEKDN